MLFSIYLKRVMFRACIPLFPVLQAWWPFRVAMLCRVLSLFLARHYPEGCLLD